MGNFPQHNSVGSIKTKHWFLTHAIWRNKHGSYQPETGVRSIVDGEVQDDFRLIEHGCDQWPKVTLIILKALDKGWPPNRIGNFIQQLADRNAATG